MLTISDLIPGAIVSNGKLTVDLSSIDVTVPEPSAEDVTYGLLNTIYSNYSLLGEKPKDLLVSRATLNAPAVPGSAPTMQPIQQRFNVQFNGLVDTTQFKPTF